MTRSIVLLSGGLDSTTALAVEASMRKPSEILALTLFYGQKHDREIESAKKVAEYFNVQHMIRDLSEVFSLDKNCSLLKSSAAEIPKSTYQTQIKTTGTPPTYVPFRNGVFLSYAAAIAYSIGAEEIIYGAHSDDAGAAYPDCSLPFFSYMKEAIKYGTGEKVVLHAPFIYFKKADIVRVGVEYNAPFHLTWSCYEGKETPCFKCATCIDRLKAFEANGLVDPLLKNAERL